MTARDDQDTLVGLARTISDGATICYRAALLVPFGELGLVGYVQP